MEDKLWWRITFDERYPLMEDNLWLNTTFDGGRPLMEDDLRWKITFYARQSLMTDDILMEDLLWRPLIEYLNKDVQFFSDINMILASTEHELGTTTTIASSCNSEREGTKCPKVCGSWGYDKEPKPSCNSSLPQIWRSANKIVVIHWSRT